MRLLTVQESKEVNGGIAETLAIVMIVTAFFNFMSK